MADICSSFGALRFSSDTLHHTTNTPAAQMPVLDDAMRMDIPGTVEDRSGHTCLIILPADKPPARVSAIHLLCLVPYACASFTSVAFTISEGTIGFSHMLKVSMHTAVHLLSNVQGEALAVERLLKDLLKEPMQAAHK